MRAEVGLVIFVTEMQKSYAFLLSFGCKSVADWIMLRQKRFSIKTGYFKYTLKILQESSKGVNCYHQLKVFKFYLIKILNIIKTISLYIKVYTDGQDGHNAKCLLPQISILGALDLCPTKDVSISEIIKIFSVSIWMHMCHFHAERYVS